LIEAIEGSVVTEKARRIGVIGLGLVGRAMAARLVAAHKAYLDSNGSFKALLVSLLSSESFLYRTTPTEGAKK
jgi:3-hydroxyisobutyrate dehydrogenase-like beta-hydroxyacid dehydrogenase